MRNLSNLLVFINIFRFMNEFRLAFASANARRKGTRHGTEQPLYKRKLKNNGDKCPIRQAEKVLYPIQPYGKKLAEVSYMSHSCQLHDGKAKVVW
jgi:hypothetical protein